MECGHTRNEKVLHIDSGYCSICLYRLVETAFREAYRSGRQVVYIDEENVAWEKFKRSRMRNVLQG